MISSGVNLKTQRPRSKPKEPSICCTLILWWLSQEPVVPMSFLRAKPIGVMPMIDQGEQDDKIIAVHADDPEFKGYSDISELPKHRLMEIKRFFEDYK